MALNPITASPKTYIKFTNSHPSVLFKRNTSCNKCNKRDINIYIKNYKSKSGYTSSVLNIYCGVLVTVRPLVVNYGAAGLFSNQLT